MISKKRIMSKKMFNLKKASRNLSKSAKALTKSSMKKKRKQRERGLRDLRSKRFIA